jgi:hypothetical protein
VLLLAPNAAHAADAGMETVAYWRKTVGHSGSFTIGSFAVGYAAETVASIDWVATRSANLEAYLRYTASPETATTIG